MTDSGERADSRARDTVGRYVRSRLVSGLFVLVPVWITIVVVQAVFKAMASFLAPLVQALPWALPPLAVKGLAVLAFLLLVLVCGIVASRMVGRRLLAWGESVILRIPLVKSIYSASKQVVDAISMTNQSSFKSVVMVEYPRPGLRVLAFMTGISTDGQGRRLARVFIPTAPNPTSGFLQLIPVEELQSTDMTVEAGLKMIVSGGFIAPPQITTRPFCEES